MTRILLATVLTVCLTGGSALAASTPNAKRQPKLSGTWAGHYAGPFTGTFTLHWTQSGAKLRGSITLSNPGGTFSISGSVHGGAITFGAVGAGATYTGSVSGKSMSGHWRSPQGGGTWSAHKRS